MSAIKSYSYDLENFIIENRELAENNPLNLLHRNDALDLYYLNVSEEMFIEYVNNILDFCYKQG